MGNSGRFTPGLKLVGYDIKYVYSVCQTKEMIAAVLRYHSTFIGEIIDFL